MRLTICPEYCGYMEETIVVKLLVGYTVPVLHGKFFVLEASSVCSNIVPSWNKERHVSQLNRHYASLFR